MHTSDIDAEKERYEASPMKSNVIRFPGSREVMDYAEDPSPTEARKQERARLHQKLDVILDDADDGCPWSPARVRDGVIKEIIDCYLNPGKYRPGTSHDS